MLWHISLLDAFFSAANTASLAPRNEMLALIPGTISRPADIYLPCLGHDCDIYPPEENSVGCI